MAEDIYGDSLESDYEFEYKEELGKDIALDNIGDISSDMNSNFLEVSGKDCRNQMLINLLEKQSDDIILEGLGGDLLDMVDKRGNIDLVIFDEALEEIANHFVTLDPSKTTIHKVKQNDGSRVFLISLVDTDDTTIEYTLGNL